MRLVIIDTFGLIHRAYHALPKLTTPKSEPIGAVYGVSTLLMKMFKELQPDYVVAAFDLPEKTFRHEAYAEYQAQRPEMADDLSSQIPKVQELIEAFGIPIFSQAGYEADDLIGTVAEQLKSEGKVEVIIVSGDLDMLQLVAPKVKVYTLKKGLSETVLYDENAVRERFGFRPELLPDFKGLKGDASDNIPGVPGVGEKTASTLIGRLGKLEELFAALKEDSLRVLEEKIVTSRVREVLLKHEKEAFFSRDLATIRRNVPVKLDLTQARIQPALERVRSLFESWGFHSLTARLKEFEPALSVSIPATVPRHTGKTVLLDRDQAWGELERAAKNREANFFSCVPSQGSSFSKLEAFSVAVTNDSVFLWAKEFPLERKHIQILEALPPAYVWSGKAAVHVMRSVEVTLPPFLLDCQVVGWLLDPEAKRYGLEDLVKKYLGVLPEIAPLHINPALNALIYEGDLLQGVAPVLEARLAEHELKKVWIAIEKPLTPVLAAMETLGIRVTPASLGQLARELRKALAGMEKKIIQLAGERFNIASPRQLSRILFETLHIPSKGLRRTASGLVSTDVAELEKIKNEHPIISLIFEWREYSKMLTTYVDALPALIRPETGRVHTTFLQTGTATGRLASENPNLQNIPTRGELAKELRRSFCAEKGWIFAAFDYSQIELRVVSHLAKDKKMIEAFQNGLDIHVLTASQVWNVPFEKVTPEMRSQAKTLNFGVLYGMGARAFSQTSGIPFEEAKQFIAEYFLDFSGVARYLEEARELARTKGYAETPTGRKRPLPDLFSDARAVHAAAERMAINMPIQGFAADIIKLAMVKIFEELKNLGFLADVRPLLQVHDELLFEIKREKIGTVVPILKEIMENAYPLDVPLVVGVTTGGSWGELMPYSNSAHE